MPHDDIDELIKSESKINDHIYRVFFEISVSDPEGKVTWGFHEIDILSGADAMEAVEKARAIVMKPDTTASINDGIHKDCDILGFRLRGVKLLAQAEVI